MIVKLLFSNRQRVHVMSQSQLKALDFVIEKKCSKNHILRAIQTFQIITYTDSYACKAKVD